MVAAARACAAAGLPVLCASNPLWERWIRSHGVQWRVLTQLVESHVTQSVAYPDIPEAQTGRSGLGTLQQRIRDFQQRDSARSGLQTLLADVALVVCSATLPRLRTFVEQSGIPCIGVARSAAAPSLQRVRPTPLLYAAATALMAPEVVQSPLERICGEWLLPSEGDIPASLARFLRVNQPYIIVTHGAFLAKSASHVVRTTITAAHGLGMRVLALMPSDSTDIQSDSQTLVWHHALAHDEIFAGAACVVHPGGAGTTQRSVRAGVPSLPIPLASSDRYWATRALQVQLTSAVIQPDALTVPLLSDALAHTITDVTYRYRAREYAVQMANEHGLTQMLGIIGPYLGAP